MVANTVRSTCQSSVTNLSRFRYHTGATPSRLADFNLPVLFRDVGPLGMSLFLSGRLKRLAGPLSPVLYLRTGAYVEPYQDSEEIGRLAFLRPAELDPWFSGSEDIYIADSGLIPERFSIVFVPTSLANQDGATRVSQCTNIGSVREELGSHIYDEMLRDVRYRTARLISEQQASEVIARPVRMTFQKGSMAERYALRESMGRYGITESDLCSAWHHVSVDRREALNAWLEIRSKEARHEAK
jgi:hypothetical protein